MCSWLLRKVGLQCISLVTKDATQRQEITLDSQHTCFQLRDTFKMIPLKTLKAIEMTFDLTSSNVFTVNIVEVRIQSLKTSADTLFTHLLPPFLVQVSC